MLLLFFKYKYNFTFLPLFRFWRVTPPNATVSGNKYIAVPTDNHRQSGDEPVNCLEHSCGSSEVPIHVDDEEAQPGNQNCDFHVVPLTVSCTCVIKTSAALVQITERYGIADFMNFMKFLQSDEINFVIEITLSLTFL